MGTGQIESSGVLADGFLYNVMIEVCADSRDSDRAQQLVGQPKLSISKPQTLDHNLESETLNPQTSTPQRQTHLLETATPNSEGESRSPRD